VTPADRLTEDEVADRVGTTPERIRRLAELGVLRSVDGSYPRSDVLRARVVVGLRDLGVGDEEIAAAVASGDLSLGYLEAAGRRPVRSDRTHVELSETVGIPFATLERIFVAFGLPPPAPDEPAREEDLQMIEHLPVQLGSGVGEGDVLRMARVWGDSARRVAQFQSHYLHASIEAPFRARGLRDNEAFEAALREVGVRAGRSGEDLLGWLFRRHAETYQTEHVLEHVETALEDAGVRSKPAPGVEACVFADLTGYTSLTEELGDAAAADVALRLAGVVSEVASEHRGQVVKMLGDGVHFHFRDPHDAISASLTIVERAVRAGLPPAHVGVNAGPMIYDEGDYFGRTVNIAARIASQAGPGRVFVGEDVEAVVGQVGFRLAEVGRFDLKGIARPVRILEAVRDDASGPG
jgi:adenylate cyclase